MVLALDGDSTMTSFVPWPLPAAALVLVLALLPPPLFAFEVLLTSPAAFVLAGTLFPSLHLRRNRRPYPWSHAAPQLKPSSRFSVFPRALLQTRLILLPQVESLVNSSTIGPMAEYAYLVVYLPRGTSRDARDAARRILTDHAEYGDWELSRLSLNADGSRKATLRRRIIRPVRTF